MKKLLYLVLGLAASGAFAATTQQWCDDISGLWQSNQYGQSNIKITQTGSAPYASYAGSGTFICGNTPYTYPIDASKTKWVRAGQWLVVFKNNPGAPSGCQSGGEVNLILPFGVTGCAGAYIGWPSGPPYPTPDYAQAAGISNHCLVPTGESNLLKGVFDDPNNPGLAHFTPALLAPNSIYVSSTYSFAGRAVYSVNSNPGTTSGYCSPVPITINTTGGTDYIADGNIADDYLGWYGASASPSNNVSQIRYHELPQDYPCNLTVTETMYMDCPLYSNGTGQSSAAYTTPPANLNGYQVNADGTVIITRNLTLTNPSNQPFGVALPAALQASLPFLWPGTYGY